MAEISQIRIKSRNSLFESAMGQAEQEYKKKKKTKRKKRHEDLNPFSSFDIPGVSKIIISPSVQKVIECSVGEHVTAENPWKYVPKQIFEGNLKHQKGDSEFLQIKEELLNYPRRELLLGYIPEEGREYDEFFICLTELAEEAVSEIITDLRKQQTEKLNKLILRTSNPWKSQGSDADVELLIDRNNRPLLELEIESQYPIISTKSFFKYRMVADVRDGYVELLPGRLAYVNIPKKTIDACIQAASSVNSNEAQTLCTYPKNEWTQYEYKCEPITELSEEIEENLTSFVTTNMECINDMICVNSNINFYKSDYIELVKDERYTSLTDVTQMKECLFFLDVDICRRKVITNVAWHPTWTGILAAVYANYAPNINRKHTIYHDEVTEAIYDVGPVLVWSVADSLHPKLFLETSREITTLSFCPFYEDLLVGGCKNGQIIMWDITGKLNTSEMESTQTPIQQKFKNLMYSLLKWMKNIKDLKTVKFTAMSDAKYSHKSAVTAIKWISPFRELTKLGQIRDIPEKEKRTSLQLVTTSTDGSVLFWNLQPNLLIRIDKRMKQQRRVKKLPTALIITESPLQSLHKILRPIFKLDVLAPNTKQNLSLVALDITSVAFKYEERQINLKHRFDVFKPVHSTITLTKPTNLLINQFIAGTAEGDFLRATWEELEFDPEETLNKQSCKLENVIKFHDGPIVSLSKTDMFPNLILTVGGKVFALWKIDFISKPIFWRKSKHHYTHGVWNNYRPTIFKLSRDDGYLEVWHLRTRSDRYEEILPISEIALLGTYAHPVTLEKNLLGFADFNGSFRLFCVSHYLDHISCDDHQIFSKMCQRDVERKLAFSKWQEHWKQKNAVWLKQKYEQKLKEEKEREEQFKREKRKQDELRKQRVKEEAIRLALLAKPQPGKFKEWADRQWRKQEQVRLSKVLLKQKDLDKEFLEKQQMPLTKLSDEEHSKKQRQEKHLGEVKQLFNTTVFTLFPEAIEKPLAPTPDPYAEQASQKTKTEIFGDYLETVKSCDDYVNPNQYTYQFNWHKILAQGSNTRRILGGQYKKTSHKDRCSKSKT